MTDLMLLKPLLWYATTLRMQGIEAGNSSCCCFVPVWCTHRLFLEAWSYKGKVSIPVPLVSNGSGCWLCLCLVSCCVDCLSLTYALKHCCNAWNSFSQTPCCIWSMCCMMHCPYTLAGASQERKPRAKREARARGGPEEDEEEDILVSYQ